MLQEEDPVADSVVVEEPHEAELEELVEVSEAAVDHEVNKSKQNHECMHCVSLMKNKLYNLQTISSFRWFTWWTSWRSWGWQRPRSSKRTWRYVFVLFFSSLFGSSFYLQNIANAQESCSIITCYHYNLNIRSRRKARWFQRRQNRRYRTPSSW